MNETIKRDLITKISIILSGIDKDELASPDGWWATTTGSKFGAKKLNEIIELINNYD